MTKRNIFKNVFTAGIFLFLLGGVGSVSASEASDWKIQADQLLKRGETRSAISLYEKVIQRDPRFANAFYNLATAYYLEGKTNKATRHLEQFVRLEPNDSEALYNLGCLRLHLGRFEEALRCFLKAENCPCVPIVADKIKEALHFMKDLRGQNPETQNLIAYVLSGSLLANAS